MLKELYYYQREYQKASGQKQNLSVNGGGQVLGASTKSLTSIVENGALSQNYSPVTAKASSSNNNSLNISAPKVSFASLFLEELWNTVSGASKWVATTAKNIVVQTVNDGKVCIKSGSVQDCLSTCGVSMDGATVALSPTVIGAGVAAGVGVICDFTNGLIYLAKERCQSRTTASAERIVFVSEGVSECFRKQAESFSQWRWASFGSQHQKSRLGNLVIL